MTRFKEGAHVFVSSWDEAGVVVEDCDTGYYVRGLTKRDFVSDEDLEGVAHGNIGDAVGSN